MKQGLYLVRIARIHRDLQINNFTKQLKLLFGGKKNGNKTSTRKSFTLRKTKY
jgi:hypothetical protein